MDIKEINDYGQELIERLKLKTSPVAVKLVPTGEQVPEGIKKAEEAMRHCQMIDLVRRTGQEFYATADEQQCKQRAEGSELRGAQHPGGHEGLRIAQDLSDAERGGDQ